MQAAQHVDFDLPLYRSGHLHDAHCFVDEVVYAPIADKLYVLASCF